LRLLIVIAYFPQDNFHGYQQVNSLAVTGSQPIRDEWGGQVCGWRAVLAKPGIEEERQAEAVARIGP
jgi:hypothetical protein